jgi:small-conductance mechanosensitive channel
MLDCVPAAASFWSEHRNGLTAIGTILVAVAVAQLVDRAVARRGRRLRERFGTELSPVASTRLRLVRRLVYAAIIVIGVGLALSQFPSIKRFAAGLLASSAIIGIVVGFAARQTIANAIAGILLAITQPIRIGDVVTFKDSTGTVEDIRLSYTYLRASDGRRIVIPNEQLAQSAIENQSISGGRLRAAASVWVKQPADALRALDVLAEPDVDVTIAEIDKDGIRLEASAWVSDPAERDTRSAGLRMACLERLAREGLSSEGGS